MSIRTIDVAYDYLKTQNHSVPFKQLWEVVRSELGFDESQSRKKISQFYTDLSLDSRFTALENNEWDLKKKHRFDETFIDTSALIDDDSDDEEEIIDEEDDLFVIDDDSKEEMM